jgi:hypothetical protein
MPYLSCPSCRLTVYNPPTVAAPEHCPRCHVPLSERASSLFHPDRAQKLSASEVADVLRQRAAARGTTDAPEE